MNSRRDFLQVSGMGLLSAALPTGAWPRGEVGGAEAAARGEPLFRFLQVNDTHYQSVGAEVIHPTYLGANARFHWFLEAVRSGGVFPAVDFVLHAGDMTHQHAVDRRRELRHFKSLLDTLPVPVHVAVGNHENVQGEGEAEKEAPYREVFGEWFDYHFVHRGIGFVFTDATGTGMPGLSPARVAARERRLRENLEAVGERPIVVVSHVPLLPVRERAVLEKSFGFVSYCLREPGLLQIVRENRRRIVTVLSGHLHLSGTVIDDGVAHVVVAGTASYPHDVAVHSVYPDALVTEFVRLPSDQMVPSTNLHGAHRFGYDFTDTAHPDWTGYVMGAPGERRLSSPLRGRA
jgi:DNA repair exonuclease SbcCD nuclease subunit